MTTLPTAAPTVIFQKLDDGAVLFAPQTELYFGLNQVGALIWELLPPRTETMDALCAEVSRSFPEVEPATIRGDVEELLAQLVLEGLARPAAADGTDASATA